MIASEAYQRPPHIYGEILSSYVYQSRDEVPGIGRFLSQGTAAGAVIYFLMSLTVLLLQPPHTSNFYFVLLLPFALVWGMLLGLFEGLVIWAGTNVVGRRISVAARGALGVAAMVLTLWFLNLHPAVDITDPLIVAVFLSTGPAYGLVTGSRLQPWRELVRGSVGIKSRLLPGITGVALRSLLILGVMESILAVVCTAEPYSRQRDFAFALIALCHFAVASVIVVARLKFWLLLPLALLINVPTVLLITEVLKNEPAVYRYFTVSYLAIWAAFLLARCSLTYSVLNVLKEELRYYLID